MLFGRLGENYGASWGREELSIGMECSIRACCELGILGKAIMTYTSEQDVENVF